jgi:hypothetical protein
VILTDFPLAFQDLGDLQGKDPLLSSIIAQLRKGKSVGEYSIRKGILYCRNSKRVDSKIVVPATAIPIIFEYFHESTLGGHLGVYKAIRKTRAQFMWKGMARIFEIACHLCSVSKPARTSHWGMLSSEVAKRPMQKIFIDYVGKLPRSKAGNSAILVCVDAFSKFVWIVPVREVTTKGTIKALKEKIVGVISGATRKIEVQVGNLRVGALLDSGSMRSIISQKQLQELKSANTKLQCNPTEVNYVTASGQSGLLSQIYPSSCHCVGTFECST